MIIIGQYAEAEVSLYLYYTYLTHFTYHWAENENDKFDFVKYLHEKEPAM